MPLMPPAALISLTASWLPLAASLSIDESAPVLPYGIPKRTVLPEAATGAVVGAAAAAVVGAADGTALGLGAAAEGLAAAAAQWTRRGRGRWRGRRRGCRRGRRFSRGRGRRATVGAAAGVLHAVTNSASASRC